MLEKILVTIYFIGIVIMFGLGLALAVSGSEVTFMAVAFGALVWPVVLVAWIALNFMI